MKNLTNVLCGAVVVASSLVSANAAAWLTFDNNASSGVGWAGTKNKIKVEVVYHSGYTYPISNRRPLINGFWTNYDIASNIIDLANAPSQSDVHSIKVTTDGTDAFWIDRVLWDSKRWGANNSQGWCVSNDSGDCNNGNTPARRAYSCLRFQLSNELVYAC